MGEIHETFQRIPWEVEAEKEYVVIVVPGGVGATLLFEGWKEAGIGDLVYRVDPANSSTKGERHIHIAHKKHMAVKKEQVSWNQSGTRHDKKSFNAGFSPRGAAEELARKVLNIPAGVILEQLDARRGMELLLESEAEDNFPSNAIVLQLVCE